jgi:hypothetical protein
MLDPGVRRVARDVGQKLVQIDRAELASLRRRERLGLT